MFLGANEHTTQPYSTETSILKHPLTAAYITADSPGGGPWDRQDISEQLLTAWVSFSGRGSLRLSLSHPYAR